MNRFPLFLSHYHSGTPVVFLLALLLLLSSSAADANDFWTTMAPAPSIVSSGGALVYPGSGDTIYALGGNLTTNFWAYNTVTNTLRRPRRGLVFASAWTGRPMRITSISAKTSRRA